MHLNFQAAGFGRQNNALGAGGWVRAGMGAFGRRNTAKIAKKPLKSRIGNRVNLECTCYAATLIILIFGLY